MDKEDGDYYKAMARLHYLEIPVNLGYKHSFEKNDLSIFTFVGPYIGMALGGKIIGKYKIDGEKDKDSEKIDFGKDNISRVDAGLNIGAGVEYKKINFWIQYGVGLANLLGKDARGTDDYKAKLMTRTLGITVGYRLGKDKE